MEVTNQTYTEFILKGFSGSPTSNIIVFITLLLLYIITLIGNVSIIVIICTDYRLHSQMYFFLVCLSFMELSGISSVTPKFLLTFLEQKVTISKNECFAQSYVYIFVSSSDFLLLTVMSFDRYIAICYPLRYTTILKKSTCVKLVAGCFISSFFFLLYPTLVIPNLPFCGHIMDYIFCKSAAMMKLICADVSLLKLYEFLSSSFVLIGSLMLTTVSYILIVSAIIRISSDTGRHRTISTCFSHLTMVCIVFGSAIFIEVRPTENYSMETDKLVNLVSTVLGPLLNPFIYTLRNQKVKDCIKDAVRRKKC